MSQKPLRVALFTETFLPKVDGVVTITCLTLDHLRSIGAEAIVFAAGERVESYAGYPVVSMPGMPAMIYPELTLSIPGGKYYEMLRDFDPDVVHVINPVMSGLRGMQFARKLDKPLIASFHTHLMEMARFYNFGMFEDFLWYLHRLAYRQADMVLATSERIVGQLESQGFGDVQLWRRGVDVERFSPSFASDEMRWRLSDGNPDKTLLISAGRLAPEKQVEQIVDVLAHVPDVHLAIIGDGPHREKLEQVFAGYPVTFMGYMRGHELSMAYASSDVFVFPSSSIETFGLVVAEAMASGLAVVASDVGGVPELIQHGVNGYIFEENNTQQMIAAVQALTEHAHRERVAARAHASVQNRTWEHIMDELVQTYDSLIASYHQRVGAA